MVSVVVFGQLELASFLILSCLEVVSLLVATTLVCFLQIPLFEIVVLREHSCLIHRSCSSYVPYDLL
jgi:hypothetical protein